MARNYQRKSPAAGGLTPEEVNSRKKSYFLRILLENGGFKEAAIRTCRTSRRWFNEQLEVDEEFALAVQTIVDMTNEELVVEARRRATGYEEPIVYQGKVQGKWVDGKGHEVSATTPGARLVPASVTKVSDVLLMFLIKGRMPEYRDGPGARKGMDISPEEMKEAVRRYLARKGGRPADDTQPTEAVN